MERKAVNPWTWSLKYGFNQGELVEGHSRVLYCSGQAAIDSDGRPRHKDDIRAQIAMALDNLDAVLQEAGMTLANVVRLIIYTTEPDLMAKNFDVLSNRLAQAGVMPAQTFLAVSRLAFLDLLVEFEATAVA